MTETTTDRNLQIVFSPAKRKFCFHRCSLTPPSSSSSGRKPPLSCSVSQPHKVSSSQTISFPAEDPHVLAPITLWCRGQGHKACPDEVEKAMSDRFTSLPKKKQEISQALKISYNSISELFKKNRTHCHWKNNAFQDLMEHLNRQAKSHFVPVMSSALETLVENFKKLDQFLTQQNFSCCAWETVRQDILVVMDHFRKMTRPRTHV
ncbi:uncharacterized protein LOC107662404 isoform X1 [Sinocyclocheilus anshuiensis]|uniref:uncharacterized protein LOC107662404 isoform X1 n=1 Tax=Sinocyclocheilus anshuiensis TaxID=1608454 RepID=UPI0007BABE68|nr:PREDICTED: uncharacterized protein LOC107662404 isoform X1 [Sinocyclocheilus anshuiensis]